MLDIDPADRAIGASWRERQHGVVARWQLLRAWAWRRAAIDGRIDAGSLHALHRGVYVVGRRG